MGDVVVDFLAKVVGLRVCWIRTFVFFRVIPSDVLFAFFGTMS